MRFGGEREERLLLLLLFGFGNPCWELGLGDSTGDEEDEDVAWVCEGKMDMKFLQGTGFGFELRHCFASLYLFLLQILCCDFKMPFISLSFTLFLAAYSPLRTGIDSTATNLSNV